MKQHISRLRRCVLILILLLTSCSRAAESPVPEEIKLSYTGTAYDLPLLAAYQNGYFEEAGLKVVLVPVKSGELGEEMLKGTVDGGTAGAGILEKIYAGLPAKIGGGVRGACVEILTLKTAEISGIEQLGNKKIGVVTGEAGIAAAAAAWEVLKQKKVEDYQSIEWVMAEEKELAGALREKRIDALVHWQGEETAITEEAAVIYQNSFVKTEGGEHSHGSNPHFYESYAVISSRLAEDYPESASNLLSAWMKGVNAVAGGLAYQLDLAEAEGFITDASYNEELKRYMFVPGVKTVPGNLKAIAEFEKQIGLLKAKTELDELIKKAFIKLLPDWG